MAEKPKNLEERAALFAEGVREFVRKLPRTISNIEDVKQLVRASGSVAANCIEGNEALGDRNRVMNPHLPKRGEGMRAVAPAGPHRG